MPCVGCMSVLSCRLPLPSSDATLDFRSAETACRPDMSIMSLCSACSLGVPQLWPMLLGHLPPQIRITTRLLGPGSNRANSKQAGRRHEPHEAQPPGCELQAARRHVGGRKEPSEAQHPKVARPRHGLGDRNFSIVSAVSVLRPGTPSPNPASCFVQGTKTQDARLFPTSSTLVLSNSQLTHWAN